MSVLNNGQYIFSIVFQDTYESGSGYTYFYITVPPKIYDLMITDQHYEQPAGTLAKVDSNGVVQLDHNVPAVLVFTTKAVGLNSTTFSPLVFSYINNFLAATLPISLPQLSIGPVITRSPFMPSLTGVFTGTVRVDAVGAPIAETYLDNNTSRRVVKVSPPKNLNISSVRIGQTVWDPVDAGNSQPTLVLQKSFAPEVTLDNQSLTANSKGTFRVRMKYEDVDYLSEPMKLTDFAKSDSVIHPERPEMTRLHVKPSILGTGGIQISLEAVTADPTKIEKAFFEKQFSVVKTQQLIVKAFPLTSPLCGTKPCYGPVSSNDVARFKAYDLAPLLPIEDGGYFYQPSSSVTAVGSNDLTLVPFDADPISQGVLLDLARIKDLKKSKATRGAGVVGIGYFKFHDPNSLDWIGVAKGDSFLIQKDQDSGFAHELIHTFVNSKELTCAEDYLCAKDLKTDGYDATNGSPKIAKLSVMGLNAQLSQVWIDSARYSLMLRDMQRPAVDPKMFVISGLIDREGTFTFISSRVTEGNLDQDSGSDLKIQAVNTSGSVISTLSLAEDFKLKLLYRDITTAEFQKPEIETSRAPLAVAIPFDENLEAVAFTLNGKRPTLIEPFGNSLVNMAEQVPLNAIRFLPVLTQKVVIADCKAISTALAKRRNLEALALLVVLKAELALNVMPFTIADGSVSRDRFIALVNSSIASVNKRIKAGRK